MVFVPSWRILDILAVNPTLNMGIATVPQALSNEPAAWASFWMLAVPASSKNAAAAWSFINYVGSEEAELLMFSEASKIRPFGAPYARVSAAPQLSANTYLKPVLDEAPFAKSAELSARAGDDKVTNALKDAVNAVLKGSANSVTALKNFAEGKPQP
jgi:ABC-type glycerol-3-phosphate transport system substrate-binding protein